MTDALAKVKKKLQDEITTLEHEMSVELPKELMKARAHGDLSENAEFKYAKERQGLCFGASRPIEETHGRPRHAELE